MSSSVAAKAGLADERTAVSPLAGKRPPREITEVVRTTSGFEATLVVKAAKQVLGK
jgi:hypothetical protein